jgi:hypothetical protein
MLHNIFHHRQCSGVDKTRRQKREKGCAVQSELLCCAHLKIDSPNDDSVNQDIDKWNFGQLARTPPLLGLAPQYCTALVALHDRRILRSDDLYEAYLLLSYILLSAENTKNTARTLERDLKTTARCLSYALWSLKPPMSRMDNPPRKTIDILPTLSVHRPCPSMLTVPRDGAECNSAVLMVIKKRKMPTSETAHPRVLCIGAHRPSSPHRTSYAML